MLLLASTALAEASEVIWTPRPELQVTFFSGLSTFVLDDPDYLAVVARADAALYEAKRTGRNRLVVR